MEQDENRIALFPLNLVLFPYTPLPLHIFEQRFRLMIARCLEENRPFGVVHAGTKQMPVVGCLARIDRVLQRYEDERLDILCFGSRRFRAIETFSEEPWPTAAVEFFDDRDRDAPLEPLAREIIKQLELYAAVVGGTIERDALLELQPHKLSFVAAATGVFSLEEKQKLLQLESTAERLQIIVASLRQAIARRRMARSAQRVLGSGENINHLLN